MSSPNATALVATLSSSDEGIEALRCGLEHAGFATVTARIAEIQKGTLDLVAFIDEHDPQVIVYDLPRPYESHWSFVRLIRETDSLKQRAWVFTTTDKQAMVATVGPANIVEIIVGQPYGVTDVVEAVRLALA